ncbi:MAG: chloride channel protein [Spirochaetaceae bacterium]|nr:MAG: chloride channel protein [Spirochaetaceae bacterium]
MMQLAVSSSYISCEYRTGFICRRTMRVAENMLTSAISRHRKTVPLILLYVMVGIVAGVGAILFQQLLSLINIYLMQGLVGYMDIQIVSGIRRFRLPWPPPQFRIWLFPLVAGLGGLLTGIIVQRYAPEAAGHGTDEVIAAYHHHDGEMRLRASIVKLLCSAITLGSGGSGGKEGPIAQIGAGFGSFICTRIPYYRAYRREIMLAGMAAGIGAIFRAPLAGAIFAAEILYSHTNYNGKVLIPAILASSVSYGIYAIYFGFARVIAVPAFAYQFSLSHLPSFTILGLVAALGAILFVRVFYGIRDLFRRISIHPRLKPAIGGFATGCIAIFVPGALGEGSLYMQRIVHGELAFGALAVLLVAKMVTTGLSIGSGGSGGIFGPSLFIGAALGGVFAGFHALLFPASNIPAVVFVLLGMVAFFSGAANAPISTVLIVSEMSGAFSLLLPFLWVAVISYIFSQSRNIYENQDPIEGSILDQT